MIFRSKRGDGLTARPYIVFIDDNGNAHNPFILPQEDPKFYSRFIKTYNIPDKELVCNCLCFWLR